MKVSGKDLLKPRDKLRSRVKLRSHDLSCDLSRARVGQFSYRGVDV